MLALTAIFLGIVDARKMLRLEVLFNRIYQHHMITPQRQILLLKYSVILTKKQPTTDSFIVMCRRLYHWRC